MPLRGHPERKSLPYCAERRADGKYILLDRDYKPKGWKGDGWADYDAWPHAFSVEITPEIAAILSYNKSDDIDRIYFYNDGCPPWGRPKDRTDYRIRLELFYEMVEGQSTEGRACCDPVGVEITRSSRLKLDSSVEPL